MARAQRVRPVRIGCRPRVGDAAADVLAQQAQVKSEQANISAAVDACKATLPQTSLDAWYVLAAQCVRFASREPAFGLADAMVTEGTSLVLQLAAWRATLTAAGCNVPTTDWRKATPNVPTPGTRSPWDFLNDVNGLLLLGLAWVVTRGGKGL